MRMFWFLLCPNLPKQTARNNNTIHNDYSKTYLAYRIIKPTVAYEQNYTEYKLSEKKSKGISDEVWVRLVIEGPSLAADSDNDEE